MAVRRTLAGLLAAPALLLPAVLAGCGDDSSVADPPVASAPQSVATSDPPARESAEQFIRRWLDVGTTMQNSGDTSIYIGMTRHCKDCNAVAKRVKAAYGHGGYYKTQGVRSVVVRPGGPSSEGPTYDLKVDFFPTTYKTSSASAVQHFEGGPGHFQVGLVKASPGWLVTSFVQVAS